MCAQHECLSGWEVTPVCDGSNGEVFHVLLSTPDESKFVRFELENDEIYDDYGSDFQALLADLLIDLYEFSELPVDELVDVGERLGFVRPAALFRALVDASARHLRSTFQTDRLWRQAQLPGIIRGDQDVAAAQPMVAFAPPCSVTEPLVAT